MVMKRPEAIDGAPACGPQRQRRMAAKRVSCLARNAGSDGRGRKLIGAIAPRRSRRQPVFGQIKPSKRPFGALGTTGIKGNEATAEQLQKSDNFVNGSRQSTSSNWTQTYCMSYPSVAPFLHLFIRFRANARRLVQGHEGRVKAGHSRCSELHRPDLCQPF